MSTAPKETALATDAAAAVPAGEVSVGSDKNRWFADEVKPHESALRAYLHRRFPSSPDMDDVVQESFVRTYLEWQRGTLTSAKGFLFTAATNITVSLFRKRKFISGTPVNELQAPHVLIGDGDVLEKICSDDDFAFAANAIAQLAPRCRQVLMLRLLSGCECREIAHKLGIAEPTVRVLLARGMKRCSELLKEQRKGGVL